MHALLISLFVKETTEHDTGDLIIYWKLRWYNPVVLLAVLAWHIIWAVIGVFRKDVRSAYKSFSEQFTYQWIATVPAKKYRKYLSAISAI